ncbi:MAG: CRISPR-associated endonuclease Cas3'' [Planctomycetota bacterium]
MERASRDPFLAHSANRGGRPEPLREHIQHVACRAASFGETLGFAEEAEAIGLLHDLGKYADRFTRRLTEDPGRPAGNHATAGAFLALQCYKHLGAMPAAAILGHHTGLAMLDARWKAWAESLNRSMQADPSSVTEPDVGLLFARFREDGFAFPRFHGALKRQGIDSDDMIDTRMLFSTLVDADYIETEAHFEGDREHPRRYRPEGPPLQPRRALAFVRKHVRQLNTSSPADSNMNAVRRDLYGCCQSAAERRPGLFTLAAPTGSGKTLSMLAFALKHAACHGHRRIVVVMPFLNIIDQTAMLYRQLFSPDKGFHRGFVLEDHSLAGVPGHNDAQDHDEDLRRMLAENWDAPIVLTTTVRCLESLMSNRPSDCRKLHRLAGSILLFDEVQTLPRELTVATLASLSRLSDRFGATVLFATATQPAFDHLDGSVRRIASAGWSPGDLLRRSARRDWFHIAAQRTTVHWEHRTPLPLETLAERLAADPAEQLMCIVNVKRQAQDLARRLARRGIKGVAHLSTSMCPLHRQHALAKVAAALAANPHQAVRLISTQCVEAGVDIDFPVVYRALAPLEAIAQAAGRCNRHGTRPDRGRLHVVKPQTDDGRICYPPGYRQAVAATECFVDQTLNAGATAESLLHDPEHLRAYYKTFYDLTGTGKAADGKEAALFKAMREADFRKVAHLYRLIADERINVLVPYDKALFDRLVDAISSDEPRPPGFLRRWIAEARPITVSIYKGSNDAPVLRRLRSIWFSRRPAVGDEPDWYVAGPDLDYDPLVGLPENREFQHIG